MRKAIVKNLFYASYFTERIGLKRLSRKLQWYAWKLALRSPAHSMAAYKRNVEKLDTSRESKKE